MTVTYPTSSHATRPVGGSMRPTGPPAWRSVTVNVQTLVDDEVVREWSGRLPDGHL
jgi:hypothetical protein